MTSTQHVAVVTGVSSGIGRAVALRLGAAGYRVFGTIRDTSSRDSIELEAKKTGIDLELVKIDVADDQSVQSGFAELLAASGRVDVLVNNAGIPGNGVVEETPASTYLDVMNVNLCGAVRCIQAVMPTMRNQGLGAIVNISSVVGRYAALAQSPYVASKWAFEGLSESLAQEAAQFGIRVVIVEPGVTRSSIFKKAVEVRNESGAYETSYRRMFHFYSVARRFATEPEAVADVVLQAVTDPEPRLRYRTSWGAEELLGGREQMSDRDWIALGAIEGDDEYYGRFLEHFGLDLR